MRIPKPRITGKLALVLVLFAAVLLAAVGVLSYFSGRAALEAATFSQLVSTATEKEAALNAWISDGQAAVTTLALSTGLLDDAAALYNSQSPAAHDRLLAELLTHASPGGSLSTVMVLDPVTGEVLVSTDPADEGKFKENLPYFLNGKMGPYVQTVYYSAGIVGPAMAAAAPLRSAEGRLLGVLAARLNIGQVNAIVQRRSDLRQTDDAFLVSNSSLFVTRPRLGSDAALQLGVHSEVVTKVLAGVNGTASANDYRGIPALIAYRWLPAFQAGLIVKVNQAEAFAPVRALGGRILLASFLALLAASALAYLLARTMTGSIKLLVKGAEEIGKGNLDYHIEVRSGDEIGQLGQGLIRMKDDLKESMVSRDELLKEVVERQRAEEGLRASEAKLQLTIDEAPIGMVSVGLEQRFLSCNKAFCDFLGCSEEELKQKTITAVTFPEDAEIGIADLRAIVAGETKSARVEKRYVRTDGGVVWGEVNINLVRDGQGRPIHFFAVVEDVTVRKRAEEALRQSEEQLRQSQKMEAVGQLAGGIAHDFNNLLTAILGYSDLLLTRKEISDSPAGEDVQEIRHAAERAGALTKQILAFSRRQALRPSVVSLNEILSGMEPLLRRTLGENINLISLQHPELGNAEIDAHQFEQVLMNLAVNARDAMPAGGHLTLETANVELDEEYCRIHPEVALGSYVMLAVSDTGIGMDEATLQHVFEPFFTTKAPGEGTGLGLAVVYGIVKQSKGNIFVYSESGKGTTFKICLPLIAEREGAETVVVSDETPSSGNERVMVVEDESSLRSLIGRVLGGVGYEVVSFGSADEAVVALEQGQEAVDLLLTDVVLPGVLQGKDLVDKVRISRPDLPVLYISGYTRNAIVHAGRLDEGVNFLEKPFTPEALARMVRMVLDQPSTSG